MTFPTPPDARLSALIQQLKNKRAKIVADHILTHGSITTEEITSIYGYQHPPRAVRDLREAGVPIETFSVLNQSGKTIAAYRFGLSENIREDRLGGRRTFPKQLKLRLYAHQNGRCAMCHGEWEMRYLQIDHRIPYEIGGELSPDDIDSYQLVWCV